MLLGTSAETAYDLRFRLLGVPVRVHPLFWLVMLLLSAQPDDLRHSALFIVCAFISFLAHEFGHALAGRWMGYEPTGVVLYGLGGYCSFYHERHTPWRRLYILACGPGAGFLLAALVFATTMLLAPGTPFALWPSEAPPVVNVLRSSDLVQSAAGILITINIIWSLLNLVPIWPLDGGQIMAVVLTMLGPQKGERRAHVVSLLLASLIALWLASVASYFNALMVGYLAYINYQWLQAEHDAYRFSSGSGGW